MIIHITVDHRIQLYTKYTQDNTTSLTAGIPTVQSAQYCDELPNGGATQGMAGGAGAGNATTTSPGMAGGTNTTNTSGANTTTVVVSPEAGGTRKGSKKLNLRHW